MLGPPDFERHDSPAGHLGGSGGPIVPLKNIPKIIILIKLPESCLSGGGLAENTRGMRVPLKRSRTAPYPLCNTRV